MVNTKPWNVIRDKLVKTIIVGLVEYVIFVNFPDFCHKNPHDSSAS